MRLGDQFPNLVIEGRSNSEMSDATMELQRKCDLYL